MTDSDETPLHDIIRLVRPLYKVLESAVEDGLQESGLTVIQRAVLDQLHLNGDMTVPAIGRALIAPRQFIQKTVDQLRISGLVARHANQAHRRSHLIALTEEGTALIGSILAREDQVIRQVAAKLDAGDLARTRQTLTGIIDAFAHNAHAKESNDDTP